MAINQKVAEQPYYMAFSHNIWNVEEHELTMTGETVTLVKMPSTFLAYVQIKNMLESIEKELFDAEHDE